MTKREEAAREWAQRYPIINRDMTYDLEAFEAGAAWEDSHGAVAQKTIERVLGLLRKQSFRNNLTCHQWADFIEAEFKETRNDTL